LPLFSGANQGLAFHPEVALHKKSKSHQRQLVDGSDPFYGTRQHMRLRNPTNGSWWMVQVRTIYVVPGEEQTLGGENNK
jgi:hypothetical protein